MKVGKVSRRKAISPLIATLILIAITIVGGVVVYRAFFSTAGTVNSNLHVSIQDVSLSTAGGLAMTVKNDGTTAVAWGTAQSLTIAGPGGTLCSSSALPSTSSLVPGETVAVSDTTCTGAVSGVTYVVTLMVSGTGSTGTVLTTSSVVAIA
jgi:flagellin-like protein